jgi:hypothetical protein
LTVRKSAVLAACWLCCTAGSRAHHPTGVCRRYAVCQMSASCVTCKTQQQRQQQQLPHLPLAPCQGSSTRQCCLCRRAVVAGDRILTPWLTVLGRGLDGGMPLVEVQLRRAGDELKGVRARVRHTHIHTTAAAGGTSSSTTLQGTQDRHSQLLHSRHGLQHKRTTAGML